MPFPEWTNLSRIGDSDRRRRDDASDPEAGEEDSEHPGSGFRSLIEHFPVSVTVLRPDGAVVYANAETENLTGYEFREIENRPFWLDAVHPEDRWKILAALPRAIEGERIVEVVRFFTRRRVPRLAEMHLFTASDRDRLLIDCVTLDITERNEAEDALFQSEALYRVFLEQSPIGMLHLSSGGTVTFENHQVRQIIGEEVEDAWIGRSIFSIDELDSRILSMLRGMLERGNAFRGVKVKYIGRSSRVQHLKMHGSPIVHPESGIVGGVVMIQDRTDEHRRKDELALRNRYDRAESQLRTAALADPKGESFLTEAVRILGEGTTADRAYLLLNNAAGDRCTESARWIREGAVPPKLSPILLDEESHIHEPASTRNPLHTLSRDSSERSRRLLEKTGADSAVWIPFYDDRRLGGVVVVERVSALSDGSCGAWLETELHLIEPLVRLFETLWSWILAGSRYRHITGTIEDCLFNLAFDEDGERRFLFLSPQIESLTGYTRSEIVAKDGPVVHWSDAVVHEDDRAFVDSHDIALREGHDSRTTYRVCHPDGTVRWLQERATPETDVTGEVLVSGILTDVTEQKKAERVLTEAMQKAESANRMKSAFIAMISHEIRTPLGAVNGFADLLARELDEHTEGRKVALPPQIPEFLEAIRENSKRLLMMVNVVFDLYNLEMDSIDLCRTSVPLHEPIMHAASTITGPLSQKSIELHVDLDSSEPTVTGDRQRMEQVFEILLSNAAKFTETGSVSIRTRRANADRAVLEVTDTGIGMSEDHVERLFEPFVQEDSRLNRRFQGSGLGLSLAKRLLDRMGGSIEVESSKGRGSTFRISLPLARAEPADDASGKAPGLRPQ